MTVCCGQSRIGQQSTGLLQLNGSRLLHGPIRKGEQSNPSGETRCRCAVHSVRSRCGQARIGQQSTGLLQLNGSRLLHGPIRKGELLLSLSYWSEWRDSNSRHPGPKRIWEFFLTFLAPFGGFIHNTRWYSKLSSPLIPPVFSVVVVKTVVRNDCPSNRIRFDFHRYCGQNCGQIETA